MSSRRPRIHLSRQADEFIDFFCRVFTGKLHGYDVLNQTPVILRQPRSIAPKIHCKGQCVEIP